MSENNRALFLVMSVALAASLGSSPALASIEKTLERDHPSLAQELTDIRKRVLTIEEELIRSLRSQEAAKGNIRRIQTLLSLQRKERKLGKKRMFELEKTIRELENRRDQLNRRIHAQRTAIHSSLKDLSVSIRRQPRGFHLPEQERLEAPRRRVLSKLVDRGLREIEALKVDLLDADQLEARIEEEKQQLTYLFQDLKEKEGVLELNQKLQVDLLRKKHDERLGQLENYQKLKKAEAQVEEMIGELNARLELEREMETERLVTRAMMQGIFAGKKGKLPMPVEGKIVSKFGRVFDAETKLHVFKKGIDISAGIAQPVRAISAGKVVFAGTLPNYGRMLILDHGEHFYSLCANLGGIHKKVGDAVAAGDVVAMTDRSGKPVYFEIRARNVPVNPLQWVSN